jgi:hypothetical protein
MTFFAMAAGTLRHGFGLAPTQIFVEFSHSFLSPIILPPFPHLLSSNPFVGRLFILTESGREVESITFSWCSYYRALQMICGIVAGHYDGEHYWKMPAGQIDTNPNHR